MKAIKKINNNIAVCLDDNGDELVAFGNGIGFPKMPYKIKDLSTIQMTFYRLNTHNFKLLKEIPESVFGVSAEIVSFAQRRLPNNLKPNTIFSLADHINFAIERSKSYKDMALPISYDIKQLYPLEYKIGKFAVSLIEERLNVSLSEQEAIAIAMHFINSVDELSDDNKKVDDLIQSIRQIIENHFKIKLDDESFEYQRFIMHFRYYLLRLQDQKQLSEDDNYSLLRALRNENPGVYNFTKELVIYIDDLLNTQTTDDELFYLCIYIRRLTIKVKAEQKNEKEL